MHKKGKLAFAVLVVLGALAAQGDTQWSEQDYDLYPGDFDGNGRTDLLYVARRPQLSSGIALSNGTEPVASAQTLAFGIQWNSQAFMPVLGDYNWDGRTDIFLQRKVAGEHYLLLARPDGTFAGIDQALPNDTAGLQWSADRHRIISMPAVDENDGTHPRGHHLFLQSSVPGGLNAIVPTGHDTLIGDQPLRTWGDGYLGFQWNLQQALVHSGDFNADGAGELLIHQR